MSGYLGNMGREVPKEDLREWAEKDANSSIADAQLTRAQLAQLNTRGFWTPTFALATPGDLSVVYSTRQGEYERRDRMMTVHCALICTPTFTTGTGEIRVSGIPQACATQRSSAMIWSAPMSFDGITKASYTTFAAQISVGAPTVIRFIASGSGQTRSALTSANITSAAQMTLIFSLTYRV